MCLHTVNNRGFILVDNDLYKSKGLDVDGK